MTLCLLLGALPTQALAFAGDIWPAVGTVQTVTLDDGSLSLQNEYIHVTLRKLCGTYAYLTVVPAAKTDEESLLVIQTPYCDFITYGDYGKKQTEGVVLTPEKEEFVTGTPNDPSAQAIKVEYSLLTALSLVTAKATVYYELVQLREGRLPRMTPGACWRRSVRSTSTRTVCPKTGIGTLRLHGGIISTALPPRDMSPLWKSRAGPPSK